jgi:hypothetical protein
MASSRSFFSEIGNESLLIPEADLDEIVGKANAERKKAFAAQQKEEIKYHYPFPPLIIRPTKSTIKFYIEELKDRYRLHNVLSPIDFDGRVKYYDIEWCKVFVHNKTQSAMADYLINFGLELADTITYHLTLNIISDFKSRSNQDPQQLCLVNGLRKRLLKDFERNTMLTSTSIAYGPQINDLVVHGCGQDQIIIRLPEKNLHELFGSIQGKPFEKSIEAFLGTNDLSKINAVYKSITDGYLPTFFHYRPLERDQNKIINQAVALTFNEMRNFTFMFVDSDEMYSARGATIQQVLT